MHDEGMWTDLRLPGLFFFQGNSLIAVHEIVRTFNLFNVFLEFPPSTICMNTIFPSDHFMSTDSCPCTQSEYFPLLEGQRSAFGSRGVGGIMNDFTTHTRDHGLTARLDTFFFHILFFCTWALSWIFHILLWDWGLLGNTEVFSSHSKRHNLQCVVSCCSYIDKSDKPPIQGAQKAS